MTANTTEFAGHTTDIAGLLTFDVTRIDDSRGWFQEKYHREKLITAGLPDGFTVVQTSVAFNRPGATRGSMRSRGTSSSRSLTDRRSQHTWICVPETTSAPW